MFHRVERRSSTASDYLSWDHFQAPDMSHRTKAQISRKKEPLLGEVFAMIIYIE